MGGQLDTTHKSFGDPPLMLAVPLLTTGSTTFATTARQVTTLVQVNSMQMSMRVPTLRATAIDDCLKAISRHIDSLKAVFHSASDAELSVTLRQYAWLSLDRIFGM